LVVKRYLNGFKYVFNVPLLSRNVTASYLKNTHVLNDFWYIVE